MAARRRFIDPTTGDYIIENGAPREDPGSTSSVYLAIKTRRGSVPGLAWFGSRFHEIRKLSPDTARLAEQYAVQAVAHLVERREIRDVTAEAELVESRLCLRVHFRDRSGARKSVPYTKTVG